jgi:rubrerythrin
MVNERMNMVEIATKVANAPASTSTEDLALLSKQALDEANHFRMVKEVIEHITGKEVDVEAAIAAETAKPTAKGAALLAKYEAQNDPLALAAYQFIAEGRAERVWNKMAECIQDEFISTTYAKIAKDEGFHSNIGRRALELISYRC